MAYLWESAAHLVNHVLFVLHVYLFVISLVSNIGFEEGLWF